MKYWYSYICSCILKSTVFELVGPFSHNPIGAHRGTASWAPEIGDQGQRYRTSGRLKLTGEPCQRRQIVAPPAVRQAAEQVLLLLHTGVRRRPVKVVGAVRLARKHRSPDPVGCGFNTVARETDKTCGRKRRETQTRQNWRVWAQLSEQGQ